MALMYLFMQAFRCKDGFAKAMPTAHHPEQGGGSVRIPRFTYIAPTFEQARDIAWDLLKSIVPPQMNLRKPNETRLELRLTNGVIINCKGADHEDALRGPGLYYALLDEYGMMKKHVWEAVIRPELASTGGGAMFIGTPCGRNHFYDLFAKGRDGERGWKSWLLPVTRPTLNFTEGVERGTQVDRFLKRPILDPDSFEDAKNSTSQKFFGQEYECDFIDSAGVVFDRIDENVVDEFREFPEVGHRYRIGFDPALHEDWAVITVLDLTDWKVKYIYRTNKIDAELLYTKVENEVNRWTTNAGRPEVVMDTTGMGDPMYDTLVKKAISIFPVKFTNKSKFEMVKNLMTLFNKGEIKIPRCEWLIDELKCYGYERLPSGRYRYGAPTGKHDDGVTSLMLVCWQLPPKSGVINPNRNYQYSNNYNKFTGIAK